MKPRAWLGLVPLLLACSSRPPGTPSSLSVPGTAHPPADPGGPPPGPGSADDIAVFAMRTLWLGDTDRTGATSSAAWKAFGLDIDDKDTTFADKDVCTLAPGAVWDTQNDGNGGIDNSFGQNLLPILITTLGSDLSQRLNGSISAGLATNLLLVRGLGSASTVSPLRASLVVAAPLGAKPSWSMSDVWPIDASSLIDGNAASPLLAFARSYEDSGVFVAEPASGSGEITLGIWNGAPLVLPIRHVQIQMTLSADGSTATEGTLSGVIPTDRLLPLVSAVSVASGLGSCSSAGNLPVQQEFVLAQDILLDGTDEAGQACNGVSIGLGFEAVRVQVGAVVDVAPLPQCGDD